jgi:hypothetical protein
MHHGQSPISRRRAVVGFGGVQEVAATAVSVADGPSGSASRRTRSWDPLFTAGCFPARLRQVYGRVIADKRRPPRAAGPLRAASTGWPARP